MMDLEKTQSNSLKKELTAGAGEWFVYDGQQVTGPHSPDALMSFQNEPGKSFLISRVGFARWYKLEELSGILEVTERLNRETAREKQRLSDSVDKSVGKLEQFASSAIEVTDPTRSIESMLAEHTLARRQKRPRKLKRRDIMSRTSRMRDHGPAMPLVSEEAVASSFESVSNQAATPTPAMEEGFVEARPRRVVSRQNLSPSPTSSNVNVVNTDQVAKTTYDREHEYYRLRGRLRLGPIRSPGLFAMLLWPLSLGLVSYWWFRDLATELTYHVFNDHKLRMPHAVWALIPGAHIYAYYHLASLMEAAEEQNHYRRTSPQTAAWLAVLPPLAMWYLQMSANRHWKLHVDHAGKRRVV